MQEEGAACELSEEKVYIGLLLLLMSTHGVVGAPLEELGCGKVAVHWFPPPSSNHSTSWPGFTQASLEVEEGEEHWGIATAVPTPLDQPRSISAPAIASRVCPGGRLLRISVWLHPWQGTMKTRWAKPGVAPVEGTMVYE